LGLVSFASSPPFPTAFYILVYFFIGSQLSNIAVLRMQQPAFKRVSLPGVQNELLPLLFYANLTACVA